MGNQQNQQQFEALFRYASIGIIFTDKNGIIVDLNDAAEKQFGYPKTELEGQKIEILIPEHFREHHHQLRTSYYKHPGPREMGSGRDLFGQKKDGTSFPVEISLSHYRLGEELFVIAFIIDISLRKESERLLLEQKSELEERADEIRHLNLDLERKVDDRTKMLKETLHELESSKDELSLSLEKEKELGELKSRFVTMASHEFRTPLSTILSSASLIMKYRKEEEQQKREKHVNRIKESVEAMKSILEDFLSLGKLEEGSLAPKPAQKSAEDIVTVVRDLVNDFEHLAKKGQTIKLSYKLNGEFNIDLNIIRNILMNLISNAIKFSGENTSIEIHLHQNKKEILIEIRDQGIGISKEDIAHLFERFFRARNAVNIQGTGLGLHIVARYLELVNGRIEVESELERGTTFVISIPKQIE